jgi:hypothetical protein
LEQATRNKSDGGVARLGLPKRKVRAMNNQRMTKARLRASLSLALVAGGIAVAGAVGSAVGAASGAGATAPIMEPCSGSGCTSHPIVGAGFHPPCDATLSGVVLGVVFVPAGKNYCLEGATVLGAVVALPSSTITADDSQVDGTLFSEGANGVELCATTVIGLSEVDASVGAVLLGDDAGDCPTDYFNGGLTLYANSGDPLQLAGDVVVGPVEVADNTDTAGPTIAANDIWGSLSCVGDATPAGNAGLPNTVHGPELGECSGL